MKISIQPLSVHDIRQACRMLTSYLPSSLIQQTIYACEGYPIYLEAATHWGDRSQTVIMGAYDGDKLMGYAEWRQSQQVYFLNNLVVDEVCRGKGIGGKLIAAGEEMAKREGAKTLSLDVFAWNEEVQQWYKRLGFVEESSTYWYEAAGAAIFSDGENPHTRVPSFRIEDYPMAEAHHAKYGFSAFTMNISERMVSIGRLGETYFRLQIREGEWDHFTSWAAALHHMDPNRSLLLLSEDPHLEELKGLVCCQRSIRMTKALN